MITQEDVRLALFGAAGFLVGYLIGCWIRNEWLGD